MAVMRVLFLSLLVASSALAADVTRYVRTDCANNGDGTVSSCAGSPGGAGAYNKIDLAYSDVVSDYTSLVTADVNLTLDLAGTAADSQTATLHITIATDATRRLRLYVAPANRHNGGEDTSKYRIVTTTPNAGIQIDTAYMEVDGLQIINTNASAGTWPETIVVREGAANGNIIIQNNVLKNADVVTTNSVGGIVCYESYCGNGVVLQIINNVIFPKYFGMHLSMAGSRTADVYNNTIYGGSRGVYSASTTTGRRRLYNNVVQNTNTSDYTLNGTAWTSDGNISEDTSSPQVALRSRTCTYTSAGTTMTLSAADTTCKDAGVNLSADSFFSFNYDMLGTMRPEGSDWDVGAHELIQLPGGGNKLLILENY